MGGRRIWLHGAAGLGVLAVVAATLAAMGRDWWCRAGDARLWAGDVWSRHNSQHLADPYTFTHVLHGLVFYALVWAAFRRLASPAGRAWIAFAIEAVWEVVENTNAVIDRYRATTMSPDYYGDSIANSLGDILACMAGYGIAGTVPVWASVVGFCVVEGVLLWWIRDSLVLNVLNLLAPSDAVQRWQLRGKGGF